MLAFIIASLIIGGILLCVSVHNTVYHDNSIFIPITILTGIYLVYLVLYFALSPANNDVRNGKAEYVKEHYIEISSNDTIEYDIYRLEWTDK